MSAKVVPLNDLSGSQDETKTVRIRKMIDEVAKALLSNSAAVVASQFPNYQTEFPRLFAMLLVPNFDKAVLERMISQMEKIEAGKQTQHQASVEVGSVLVDTYVKGKVPAGAKKNQN